MITVEQLNAIEGRPTWMGQWFAMPNPTRDREQIGWSVAAPAQESLEGFAQIYLKLDGRVDACNGDLTTTQLLEFATYARRVEIEVKRRMTPISHREPTRQEILQGMVATHDRFESQEAGRLAKTTSNQRTAGDFTKGEFPSDDVDTILVRVSYSVNWLHWSRLGASWRDIWSDRARYKLLGPWRLETVEALERRMKLGVP